MASTNAQLTVAQVQQMIQNALDQRENTNQLNLSPIANHTHNGTDSARVNAKDLIGGTGGVETVTGLNTDNTDPSNPVVKISVDGSTVTGLGTSGSPLVAHLTGSFVNAGTSTAAQYASTFHDAGNSGASIAINWANGNRQRVTLNHATPTITFSNPISGAMYSLEVLQDGSGGRVPTIPTILWPGGNPPVFSTGIGALDIISLLYDGSNYNGTFSLNFS